MNESAKNMTRFREGLKPDFPKTVEISGECNETRIITDITKPADIGGTKRLTNIRRIRNYENFFLDSAIYSVGAALGISYDDGFTPVSAVTGDLFTYMYSDEKPCDSGLTNYVYMPEVVKDAYALFGSGCFYMSNEDIQAHFDKAISFIYESIDCGIPVLAWGIGGVTFKDGNVWNPLPEGCIIGGYNREQRLLFANLYPEGERLAETSANGFPGVDEYGYTAIDGKTSIKTTNGLFFITNKIAPTAMKDVYLKALHSVPHWLTLPESNGYSYGRAAFHRWAEVLLDDANWANEDLCNANCWDKHCCAYCSICTSIGVGGGSRTLKYLEDAFREIPDYPNAGKIVSCYEKLFSLSQKIWDAHGDFMPPSDKMVKRDFRELLAGILHEMGAVCDELLPLFS